MPSIITENNNIGYVDSNTVTDGLYGKTETGITYINTTLENTL
jgi:hypothetical protein